MTNEAPRTEYLVLSRGKWDADKSPADIQPVIDQFYAWIERHVADGNMKRGQRLGSAAKLVSRDFVTDGPYTEAKEVIGGYWFILAGSLDEAAKLAAGNPCLQCGLSYEIRPIDPVLASAFNETCETPTRKGAGGERRAVRRAEKGRRPGKTVS